MVTKILAPLAAALAVVGVVVALTATSRNYATAPARPLLWTPGACVSRSDARYDLTQCNGGHAEVLTITADPPGLGACPDDTDDVLRLDGGRAACVRDFVEPHAGVPGAGGGVLRPGDCVALDGRERPCSAPSWYGRAVAVVQDAASCPKGTLDTVGALGVVCLGRGGRVLAEGMCVAEPARHVVNRSAISRVGCGSRAAWAQVTALETSARNCPDNSERYLEARGAFRPVTCLHLVSK
ncbi:hypothetical protein ABT294_19930 [Nonomuraea sp. NPDC000554]|uniref:hypothetical protein n=1 Tax=Nonomuraea sp. NPDC000554 TaxID=3154259 RepID=UPI0033234A72